MVLAFGEAEGGLTFMSQLEIRAEDGLDWSRPVQADIYVQDPAGLHAHLYDTIRPAEAEGPVSVPLSGLPRPGDPPGPEQTAASFIIDYDQSSVQKLIQELRAAHGTSPTIEELVSFTHDAISNKTSERGWDIASQVARDRAGDCTEHAVLLTALARASGYPARVSIGAAIIRMGQEIEAFGHAWTEIHDGSSWRLSDATRIQDEASVYYIGTYHVEAEGPGFLLGLMEKMQSSMVQRIALSNLAP